MPINLDITEADRALLHAALSAYIDLCSANMDADPALRDVWLAIRDRAGALDANIEQA